MPKPWVFLRRDQLIPVKKVVNEKEQLEKGQEKEEKKKYLKGSEIWSWRRYQRCRIQGCQIFLDTIYQNEGKWYTKLPQHYQMAIQYTK
jgi:hypothetical protein